MAANATQVGSGFGFDGNTVKTTILFVLCVAVFVTMISLPDMQETHVTVSNIRPGYQVIHIDQVDMYVLAVNHVRLWSC